MSTQRLGLILFYDTHITFEVYVCLLVVTGEYPALSQSKEENTDRLMDMSKSHQASSGCETQVFMCRHRTEGPMCFILLILVILII